LHTTVSVVSGLHFIKLLRRTALVVMTEQTQGMNQ
jgi:hypothetical protein